jgi:hypothetical protein
MGSGGGGPGQILQGHPPGPNPGYVSGNIEEQYSSRLSRVESWNSIILVVKLLRKQNNLQILLINRIWKTLRNLKIY